MVVRMLGYSTLAGALLGALAWALAAVTDPPRAEAPLEPIISPGVLPVLGAAGGFLAGCALAVAALAWRALRRRRSVPPAA